MVCGLWSKVFLFLPDPTMRSSFLALALLAAQLPAQSKPLITPKDFGKWEALGAPRLSPKGDWVAVPINRVSEESELRLRGGARDTTINIQYGANAVFSADGKWVAYAIGPSPKERERLTSARPPRPVRNNLEVRNLTTNKVVAVNEINTFSFSPDGRFIVMTRYAAEGKRVTDVLVENLANHTRMPFSNVGEHSWADAGARLALTIETDGGVGNAVQMYDANSGTINVLESSSSQYRQLAWRAKSTDLAVLRTRIDSAFLDTAHVLLAFANVGANANVTPLKLEPVPAAASDDTSFPAGMRIADYRRPSWSRDGKIVFFGMKKRQPKADAIKKSTEKVSDVEIWHTNDVRMFPQQKSQENADLRLTLLTAWRVSDGKVVQIGTDLNETSTALEGGRFATEIDRKPYGWGQKFGRDDEDVYVVDLASGDRKKVLEKVRHYYGGDVTGTRLTWSDGKDFWSVDLATNKRTNLSANVKADFVDHDDDHPNNVPPIINPAGWDKTGNAYLVNDTYDVWSLKADGSGGTKLTSGAANGVVHRAVNFAAGTGFGAPQGSALDRAFDLTKPLYFTIRGKKTKQSGYAVRQANGTVDRIVLADVGHSALVKADSAAVFAYARQNYVTPPTLRVGSDIANAKVVVETNAHAKDFAWGKVELMDFKSTIGVPLQALLYYPANYDASKKYPMIVYTYELLTQGYHNYITPRETDYYNTTVFTQNGYFVLMPDIVFRPREPGVGTQQSVDAAVQSVLDRNLVDAARVGHVGHSQGGYEANYLGTHSKYFATTISGSGITDMISFAGQLHWQGGSAEMDHWETGQFRMEVAPWEDMKAMIDNSPLAEVHNMKAKAMLLMIGDNDGTVDPRQGSLFYNYARRAGKQVVLLSYPGEGHGLSKKENQIDYEKRILQWFGHYLKGEPAAPWITDGMKALDRKAVLDANKEPAPPPRP
jgi:dipeptidyl aminopeptidase/acylaminoacyl peptidase